MSSWIKKFWNNGSNQGTKTLRKGTSRRLELVGLEDRITPATISLSTNTVVITLTAGESITNLNTSVAGPNITINTVGSAANTGSGTGLTVNPNSVVVDTSVLTGFDGISVIGEAGVNAVTIGTAGIDLSTAPGGANQAVSIDLSQGGADTLTVNDAIKTKGTGAVNLNSPTVSIGAGGDITSGSGAVTITGTTAISTAGDITTSDGFINFVNPTILTGAVSLNTNATTPNGDIFFDTITGGSNNLTLQTGAVLGADIFLGDVTGVNTLTVAQSSGTSFNAVSAASVVIADTSTSVVFSGNLSLSTGLTTSAQPYNVVIVGTSNSIAGNTTFLNTGAVLFGNTSSDSTTFVGGVTATDTPLVQIAGTVAATTAASTITLGDADTPVTVFSNTTVGGAATGTIDLGDATLLDGVTLTVGTGIANDINLDAVTGTAAGAASNLIINTTGTVSVAEAVGTDIGTITVTQSNEIDFFGTVDAASVIITNTNLSVRFNDNLDLTTGLTTSAQPYNLGVFGTSNSIAGTTTFLNTGIVRIGNDATDSTTLVGGVTATDASSVQIAGTVAATTAASTITLGDANSPVIVTHNTTVGGAATGTIDLGDASLSDGVTLTVGTGINNFILLDAVTGTAAGAASNLTINTTSSAFIAEAIGTDIGTITVTQSNGFGFGGTVDAASVIITDTTGGVAFNNNLNLSTGLTTTAQSYNVIFSGISNSIAGTTTFLNTGFVVFGNDATGSTTFVGGVTATDPSGVSLIGTVAATTGASTITLGDANTPVTVFTNTTVGGAATGTIDLGDATLLDGVTLTVGTGIANAINLDAVTGKAGAAASNLTINTTGSVSVAEAVGTDIGTVTITNSGGATFLDTVDTITSVLISDSVAATTVAFNAALTTPTLTITGTANAYHVSLLGSGTDIVNPVFFNNSGTATLGDSSSDILLFQSGLTSTTPSQTNLAGVVRTSGDSIAIKNLSLNSDSTLDSTNNGADPGGAPITLSGSLTFNDFTLNIIDGPTNGLTLTGDVTVTDGQLVLAQGNLNLGDGVISTTVTVNQDTLFQATTGAININSKASIAGGKNDLSFKSDTINLNGGVNSINTTAAVTIAPVTVNRDIFLGDAATGKDGINISQTQYNSVNSSASALIIGSSNYSGNLTMGTLTSNNLLTLLNQGGGGKVLITGPFTSTGGDGSIGLKILGSGATTVLSADIITLGVDVIIDDALQLDGGNRLIDTTNSDTIPTGANVLITGGNRGIFSTLAQNNGLVVDAGLSGNITIGTLTGFSDNAGLANAVQNAILVGNLVALPNNSNSVNGSLVASGTGISVNGIDATDSVTLTGAISLVDSFASITANGITMVGTVAANNGSMTLDAGATNSLLITGAVSGFNTLTVANSSTTTFVGGVNGANLILADTADTGNIIFAGSNTLGSLTTANQGYGIQFVNTSFSIANPVTFTNTGGVVVGTSPGAILSLANGGVIASGVTLSGNGTINGSITVLSGGAVAPGNSPGILTFNSGLSLNQGSSFNAEINGLVTPGTDYDQAVVTGTVSLGNATLNTTSSGSLSPNFGNVITLIANDGSDAVSGTFNGLPENSPVTVGGATFVLSYRGGDGNDVVLEFVQKQGILVSSGLGTGPGGVVSSTVSIFTQGVASPIVVTPFPYFTGDLHVATGDIDNDGTDDLIVGAGPGAGPAVAVFSGATGAPISAFFPYDPAFHGGVFVATGDLNGDNILEIITGAGPGGGPHVGVFNSNNFTSQGGFFAFDNTFTGGVSVAAGDFNNDGIDEIATGAGAGGGPNVRVFSGPGFGFSLLQSFFAYAPNFTGGVFVAAGDLQGDAADELITGAGAGGGPEVTIFNGSNSQALASFFAYDIAFKGGVRVGASDYLGDGEVDIITGAGVGGAPHVKVFSDVDSLVDQFFSGDINYRGGIFVSGGPSQVLVTSEGDPPVDPDSL